MSSAPLENQKHERFAQLVAQGASGTAAYQQVYPDSARDSCRSSAASLLAMSSVSARVSELKQLSTLSGLLTKDESQAFLADVVRSKLASLPEDSPLIQALKRKDGETTEIKIPDKIRALELNAKLSGWLDQRAEQAGTVNITLVNLSLTGDLPKLVSEPDTKPIIPV